MQKIHMQRKYIGLSGDGFYLDYYILRSEIGLPGSDFRAVTYGVEIEKKYSSGGHEQILEQATVNDIYSSMRLTEILVKKLADRLILPSTLKYIIGDLIGERGYEMPEVITTA